MNGSRSDSLRVRFKSLISLDRDADVSTCCMRVSGRNFMGDHISSYKSVWSLSTLLTMSSSTASISLPLLALSSRNSAKVWLMVIETNELVNGATREI